MNLRKCWLLKSGNEVSNYLTRASLSNDYQIQDFDFIVVFVLA
jgi:hypothetical protein